MSNYFASGLAAGMFLGRSAGRSDGIREATAHFDDEERDSIAKVLLKNPAFAKAVRDTVDDLNRTFGKPETYVPKDKITPGAHSGFLWLSYTRAKGEEADRIHGKAHAALSYYFSATSKDVGDEHIESIAYNVADDAESYDENYSLGRGIEFVTGLQPEDYAHMGRIGMIEYYKNALSDIAHYKSSTRAHIEETPDLTLKNGEGRVYNRMLVNTVQAYAAAAEESLTAYYNKAIGPADDSTANDNSNQPAPSAKRADSPRPG